MADPRFFPQRQPQNLAAIVNYTGCQVRHDADLNRLFTDVAPLDKAVADHLSFFDNPRYLPSFQHTMAGACFVRPDYQKDAPAGCIPLLTENPYKSYALAAQLFYHPKTQTTSIHPTAVIGQNVVLGDRVKIDAYAVIGDGVVIGDDSVIGAHVSISHSIIGKNVVLHPGARIGQPGFGFAPDEERPVKIPQLGRVIIEDDVEVGANSTIDRGSGPDTIIGQGTMIDNLVQIAHNVVLGRGCIIVAQVGVSGSTKIGDYTHIAGQSGIAGHLRLGKRVRVAAKSGIMRDVPDAMTVAGIPAMPIHKFFRQVAWLARMSSNRDEKHHDDN